jgi:CRISPR system Cascade subunit CasC
LELQKRIQRSKLFFGKLKKILKVNATMLIEIHMIQNHSPANLNRDDTGSPKDCIFGGVPRARISSQCLKRTIRNSPLFKEELKDMMGIRTRLMPEEVKRLLLEKGIDAKMAELAAQKAALFAQNLDKDKGTKAKKSTKKKTSKAKDEEEEDQETDETESANTAPTETGGKHQTGQIMFFSFPEIRRIATVMENAIKSAKTPEAFSNINPKTLQEDYQELKAKEKDKVEITPDIALFGRMITSDAFDDVEASMQVAHAISTNKIEREFDYFTAVDDLKSSINYADEKGASMIGDVEFNSSCFYKYFSLDTENFLKNIFGEKRDVKATELLKKTVGAFMKAAIFSNPSGKQNTFAAHQLPSAILVEIRDKNIPINYANAFLKPARLTDKYDLVESSIAQLIPHITQLTKKFALPLKSRLWFSTVSIPGITDNVESAIECNTVDDIIKKMIENI